MGDQDFMNKMIAVFIEQMPNDLKTMVEAISNNNLEMISQIAHKVKPSIDHMAIEEMHDQVRFIEKVDNSEETILVIADDFCQKVEQLIQQLKLEL